MPVFFSCPPDLNAADRAPSGCGGSLGSTSSKAHSFRAGQGPLLFDGVGLSWSVDIGFCLGRGRRETEDNHNYPYFRIHVKGRGGNFFPAAERRAARGKPSSNPSAQGFAWGRIRSGKPTSQRNSVRSRANACSRRCTAEQFGQGTGVSAGSIGSSESAAFMGPCSTQNDHFRKDQCFSQVPLLTRWQETDIFIRRI